MTERDITASPIGDAAEGRVSPRSLKRPFPPEDSDGECANSFTSTNKEADSPKCISKSVVKPGESTNAVKTNKKKPKHQESTLAPQPQLQCQHPKHEIYLKLTKSRLSRKSPAKADKERSNQLVTMFKRLEGVFDLDSKALMCKRCLRQTDKDLESTSVVS
ncbi:1184_t:CDS:2 [Acaulospora colombiana]|uniref:1184_t:CDS:1 n=1 Tax=Acaulospora colombiana TaxID=27376 RepID=A0ACA9L4W6_9GLOM|nr:1184_t:CDS:2 [Acaulospora colombiana]